jgi:branched-chain amino acid transport system permease protein
VSSNSNWTRRPLLAALLAVGILGWLFVGPFGQELLAKIAIFGIFAVSLDFLVGYAGLVSLGQAGFLGVGAYAYAYFAAVLGWPSGLALSLALVSGALVAAVLGYFAVRVAGVFFMMVTLALSMMIYAIAIKSRTFNGDDGLSGIPRLDLSSIGIALDNPAVFSIFAMLLLLAVWWSFDVLVRSPFGQTIAAIRQNENRLRALGCSVGRYKLAAFIVSGVGSALAGALMAQQDSFVNPELTYWFLSGEALIIVIVGGAGTLLGPVLGTVLVILFKESVSSLTEYWNFWTGILFVSIVLIAPDGIYGRLNAIAGKVWGKSGNA